MLAHIEEALNTALSMEKSRSAFFQQDSQRHAQIASNLMDENEKLKNQVCVFEHDLNAALLREAVLLKRLASKGKKNAK